VDRPNGSANLAETSTVAPKLGNWAKQLCKSLTRWTWDGPSKKQTSSAPVYPSMHSAAEMAIKGLWESLTEGQKREIYFDWEYREKRRGLLRTFVANHWQITRPCIRSAFYSKKQQWIIHDIYKSLLNPSWYRRFLKQLKDDTFGHEWGADQSIAIFGTPGGDRFQFVMCGRHLTLRADGFTEGRVAFGGPILYGHAASGVTEEKGHPGNIFWPQAERAHQVHQMLDGRQRASARVACLPPEERVAFERDGREISGLRVAEMSADQKAEVRNVLRALVEPFRKEDQECVNQCLQAKGGLESCFLTFYGEGTDCDESAWDNWRLEGPAFVWHFRGAPHVHVWVHVANDPAVELNARNGVFIHAEHDPLGAWPKGFVPPETQ
jgi:hypothetical protein